MDPNFVPIGNTNLSKGSLKFKNELEWTINPDESVSLFMKLMNKATQITKTSQKINLLIQSKFKYIGFDTSHTIRYEDISATENYSENTKIIDYNNAIKYGSEENLWTVENSLSQRNEVFVNSENLHSLIIGSKLSYLTNVPFNASMEKIKLSPTIPSILIKQTQHPHLIT